MMQPDEDIQFNSVRIEKPVDIGIPTHRRNIGRISRSDKGKELNRPPSVDNCLSITIPVHLAASQIADKHPPTRNSLKHSRMIITHQTSHHRERILPPFLPEHLEKVVPLTTMQIGCGIVLLFESLLILCDSPHFPIVYNPYWSGIPLLISGSCALYLQYCFKKEPQVMRPGFCFSVTKVFSLFFIVLATIACVSACVLSARHLYRTSNLECTPAQVLNATCVCKPPDSFEGAIRYMDLSCQEVEGILKSTLYSSCLANIGGFVLGIIYILDMLVIFCKI